MNCVYPTSSTPYVKLLCVVTGKQIAEHHDMVCETHAWEHGPSRTSKKKNIDATDITTMSASSRHDEEILA